MPSYTTVNHAPAARSRGFPGEGRRLGNTFPARRICLLAKVFATALSAILYRVLRLGRSAVSFCWARRRAVKRVLRARLAPAPDWQLYALVPILAWALLSVGYAGYTLLPRGSELVTAPSLPQCEVPRPSAGSSPLYADDELHYVDEVCDMTARIVALTTQPPGVVTIEAFLASANIKTTAAAGELPCEWCARSDRMCKPEDCEESWRLFNRAAMFIRLREARSVYLRVFGDRGIGVEERQARYETVCHNFWQ